jgi:hypothetical protein
MAITVSIGCFFPDIVRGFGIIIRFRQKTGEFLVSLYLQHGMMKCQKSVGSQ